MNAPVRVPPVRIVSTPGVLGGVPCIEGTRVPVATLIAELRAGTPDAIVTADYPTLPQGALEAVRLFAERQGISLNPGAAPAMNCDDTEADAWTTRGS